MTDAEFEKQARAAAAKAGATNVVVFAGVDVIGVACDYSGNRLELTMERHAALDQTSKTMILGAVARMGQPE